MLLICIYENDFIPNEENNNLCIYFELLSLLSESQSPLDLPWPSLPRTILQDDHVSRIEMELGKVEGSLPGSSAEAEVRSDIALLPRRQIRSGHITRGSDVYTHICIL